MKPEEERRHRPCHTWETVEPWEVYQETKRQTSKSKQVK
jgi:hypothetical protein